MKAISKHGASPTWTEIIDANGLPPEGAIPTIIDPDAPVDTSIGKPIKIDPVPELKPSEPEVKPEEAEQPDVTVGSAAEKAAE